jgi:surfeit locus 1 family protein
MVNTLLNARLLKFEIGAFRFNPGILTSIITLCLLYLMISLAQWQAGKAAYKEAVIEQMQQRKHLDAVILPLLPASIDERNYRPVQLMGRFDNNHQFLLDNRVYQGQAGYEVYSLFNDESGTTLLVNRGWVKQPRTREQLPDITVDDARTVLTGLLSTTPGKGLVLADNLHKADQWPVVLQYMDLAEIASLANVGLYDMVMWADETAGYSYQRVLPVLSYDSAKNTGYAFQWYALSLALIIIYIVVNTKRVESNNESVK